jgi:cytochrome c biogenesis protein CcmG, thiol:disulfide interchange protein DsbE
MAVLQRESPGLGQARPLAALLLVLSLVVGAVWLLDGGASSFSGDTSSNVVALTGNMGTGVTPRIGEPAPDFAIDSLGGAPIGLSALRGRPVIVNFWASWCPPCRGEMPDLEQVAREHRDAGLAVIAVNLDEDRAAVQRYATTLDLTLPIGLDRGGRVSTLYNLAALPTSYFVDRQGVIRDMNIGALTAKGLRTKTARVLD